MSDTAISSQIALETSADQKAMAASSADKNSVSDSQGSEFKEILSKSQKKNLQHNNVEQTQNAVLESAKFAELALDFVNLNALLNSSVLANPHFAGLNATAIPGNLLPAQQQANGLLTKTDDALVAANFLNSGLNAGITRSHLAETNPVLSSQFAINSHLSADDGLFTAQLTANLMEGNTANLKQLNAQMMSQALIKAEPVLDQDLLTSPHSSFMLNQSFALKPAGTMLPAMTVSPDNAQWNQQVGERINWMINGQMQRAEIRLDPPELGSLDIRLNIAKDNQASVLFYVNNTTAKEAIESAIPRLREMLEQQGLDLANVDVSQQSFQQQQSAFAEYDNNDANDSSPTMRLNGANQSDEETILAVTDLSTGNSAHLLDTFA